MSYAYLVGFLEAQGYAYIDVAEVFQIYLDGGGSDEDFFAFGAKGGHYSPVGHRLIADAMRADLLAHEMREQLRGRSLDQ